MSSLQSSTDALTVDASSIVDASSDTVDERASVVSKSILLKEYVDHWCHLPEQGTAQWLSDRQLFVGGSEIDSVVKRNFTTILNKKIGADKFSGNVYTTWGILFEVTTEQLFSDLFLEGSAVYTTGAIPHDTAKHRYSPDGICVITIDGTQHIVLIEIKSPFKTIPTSIVPKQYMPQVLAGLCTIKPAEFGVFINNMYRACSASQYDDEHAFNTSFHKGTLSDHPYIARGLIMFGVHVNDVKICLEALSKGFSLDDDIEELVMRNLTAIEQGNANELALIDLGEMTTDLERIFNIYKTHRSQLILDVYRSPIEFNSFEHAGNLVHEKFVRTYPEKSLVPINESLDIYRSTCISESIVPIGYLPWHLFKMAVLPVDKDPNYLDAHVDYIDSIITAVQKIRAVPAEEQSTTYQDCKAELTVLSNKQKRKK
jgi:hypothetical protein